MIPRKAGLWVLLALAPLWAACQPKTGTGLTMKSGVLTVGMEIGYPPMEYIDESGNVAGFDVQMARALAAKLGLGVEFVDTAWDGIFAGVDTGKYDCIMSAVTVTEPRLAAHNFTKPYIANTQSIVLLKSSSFRPAGPEYLEGLGVAYQEETTSDILMTGLADKGLKFTPYEYAKVMNCFDELQLGRVDAIICDSLVAVDYIALEDSPFEIVWQGSEGEVFGICLKKGNDDLTAALDKALDELFEDGTMLQISRDVFKMDMVSAAR
ncbi:MAG: transporter substrate-binding domain-containing protein [Treponema sp.]|jgi:polar amino acid transport system substrate-binding protein|nr:transporter substrate-binding domain-containing protein [Treponema sp.]